MTAARTRIARCNCGALTATARSGPVHVYLCACEKCQIKSGSAFSYAAVFAEGDVTVAGAHTAFRQAGESGRFVENHFCPVCGVAVYFHSEGLPGTIGIAAGCFAKDDGAHDAALTPQRIYWAEGKRAWVRGPDGVDEIARQ